MLSAEDRAAIAELNRRARRCAAIALWCRRLSFACFAVSLGAYILHVCL